MKAVIRGASEESAVPRRSGNKAGGSFVFGPDSSTVVVTAISCGRALAVGAFNAMTRARVASAETIGAAPVGRAAVATTTANPCGILMLESLDLSFGQSSSRAPSRLVLAIGEVFRLGEQTCDCKLPALRRFRTSPIGPIRLDLAERRSRADSASRVLGGPKKEEDSLGGFRRLFEAPPGSTQLNPCSGRS